MNKRGVLNGKEYVFSKNATYQNVFDASAQKMKDDRGLRPKDSLRDNLSIRELAFVAASQALPVERMEDEDSFGFSECRSATALSAKAIKSAIAAYRRGLKRSVK